VPWVETTTALPVTSVLQHARRHDGRHVVRLRAFDPSLDLDAAFTDIFEQARGTAELILDLSGNTGGSLTAATRLRDRFLRDTTPIGWIRFTTGTGRLDDLTPRSAEPSDLSRWNGALTVLVDAMTYSAAEDFLLGLEGLDHVRVLGESTGGGSGRPRTMKLTDDLDLTISTALTYDRTGRCIELNGIPVEPGA
jgi:carboxyl-terminal processing protease